MVKRTNGSKGPKDPVVTRVAALLRAGDPTVFRFEADCRHGIRSSMCLAGHSWPVSDVVSQEIVREALALIGARRPPWAWGQREWTQDSKFTRVDWTHCLNCGDRLLEGHRKFCGGVCASAYRRSFEDADRRAADRARRAAARESYRIHAEYLPCEQCGRLFQPSKPTQRFCSRKCSGGRSLYKKMNGRKHPWVKANGKIGGNGANGAAHSCPSTPTPDECSARPSARMPTTTNSSPASAPRPAPS